MIKIESYKTNPVAVIKAGSLNYIYTDHLGTPRAVTDTNNVLKWSWENKESFGKNLPVDNVSGTVFEFNLRLPGQYYDKETGLNYNVNRDYNPNWGRYVQSDPIGLLGGINTYGYVGGNPVGGSDELGLLPSLPQGLVDFTAGYGDSTSFGLTEWIRNYGDFNGANDCSGSYSAGGYAEVGTNIASLGASLYLRAGIKALTPSAKKLLLRQARKTIEYKNIKTQGISPHHINALIGHPGGAKRLATFPTLNLPLIISSGKGNLIGLSHLEHMQAHKKAIALENIYEIYHDSNITGLKLENNLLNK